ncbi:MAG: PAS domain S-box protein [Chitinophagaceae bacterium]|nr:PAS domain S-box protein [Chitinophagaceae bacterium]
MKKYKKQISLFLYVSLLIVIGSFAVLFFNFRKQVKLQNEILKIETNLIQADSLAANLLQIESDKRGFQLTSDVNYLKNFYNIKTNCYGNIINLKKNVITDAHTKIMGAIDSLLKLRIGNLDSGILVFTTKGFDASIEFMQRMDKKNIRELLSKEIQGLKNSLLGKLNEDTSWINKRSNHNLTGLLILLLIFIILMLFAARTFRRAQLKIIKNHIKFKEAQRIAKIGSWEWDLATNKLTWSQEQFRLFGEDRKTFDLTYQGYLNHLSGKEQVRTGALIQDALEGKANYAVEHEIIRKDGTKLMVFEQGTVLFDEKNKPTGMLGTTQDITERKKNEEELVLAQKKFQAIFDNTAEGIYQSTMDGKFIMANSAMARILGYKSEEELLRSVTDIGTQVYANSADRQRMSELLACQDHIENFESSLIKKNGELIWISESTRAVRNEKRAIMYFEGTLRDITKRKKAEEAVVLLQNKFQAIFDNTADGIYQSTIDGKFIMANPSMARIFGYDSSEELIDSVTDIGTQIYANPVERKKMAEMILVQDRVKNYELQVLTKNKDIIWVSANIRIVRDDQGAISFFEGVLEDITERKKSEEQLLSLSNRLQLAVHATSIGIWDWDLVTNTTVWDEEMYRIYNVNPSDPKSITESWEAVVHPDDLKRVNEELRMALNDEKEYDTEFRIIRKDNAIHYVKGNALVLKDQSGNAIRMTGTNADITERKEAEIEILQLNQNLDQFANITAHDLQEPIRMVSGFLGLLSKKYNDVLDEQGQSYIYRAKDGADRMSILIKDLLEFSRSGNKAAKKEPVDFAEVMDLVKKDLSIVMADTGATLHIPEFLPTVTGTQSAFYRLILNLVSNGIKFRKKDTVPEVTLTVNELPDYWEFHLQDNGIGVAEKDQPKLFNAFQRLHRREEYPGTGLGLVTCKKIVETHGGKIWMTSVLGKGTAFHFTIPKL